MTIYYYGEPLKKYYIADFVYYNSIVVELKAAQGFFKNQYEQTGNYLKAINLKLGLLVNYGTPSLTYKRILNPDYSR